MMTITDLLLLLLQDVAACTFMALAGATPEFFTNTISTFLTESEMGLGTIIGSMLFNTLGVAACAGLASIKPVQLNWFPMARDCIIFSVNIVMLVVMAWDGRIMWYEATIMFCMFIIYFVIMSQNKRIERICRYLVEVRWNCIKMTRYGNRDGGHRSMFRVGIVII